MLRDTMIERAKRESRQLIEDNQLPKFLGIGAQRAATTWLHECLAEHPEVFVPKCKEVHFFTEYYERGKDWYRQHFSEADSMQIAGEITPTYLCDENALTRVSNMVPNVRMFAILRNPIERAWSAYQLFRSRFGWSTFSDAIRNSNYLIAHGMYGHHLQKAFRRFSRDQIKIFLYEDIEHDPGRVVSEVFRLLNVDDKFIPSSISKRLNRVVLPRTQKVLRSIGFGWTISLVKRTPIAELIKKRVVPNVGPESADVDYLREQFTADIHELESIIQRDLSHWLLTAP